MKKAVIVMACAFILGSCQEKPTFTVEGVVEGAPDSLLYLEQMALDGMKKLDSIKLDGEGHFSFQGEAPDDPEFYRLRIHDQIINISVDSTETITVKAQYPNMASRYQVEGSENCSKIRELSLMQQELLSKAIALDNNRQIAPKIAQDSLVRLLDAYKKQVTEEYIYQGPNMTYSYFALFQTLGQWLIFDPQANSGDMRVFAAVATSWDTFHPNSKRTKNLHDIVIKNMKDQQIIDARNYQRENAEPMVVQSGVIELDLTDNKQQQRRLTDLRGKVVLLDFHTFKMQNSPQRILMLRGLYNKYHEQGFEIYQISLDQDEHFWRQMTLQLPWISVRDESGSSAMSYNVSEIPEYFLIDRNNTLYKRSSQMENLEDEIKTLLGKK